MLKDRLRAARYKRKLSQSQLANLIDLQPCSIANFESGRRTPKIKSLIKLCKGLRVSADWLLELKK